MQGATHGIGGSRADALTVDPDEPPALERHPLAVESVAGKRAGDVGLAFRHQPSFNWGREPASPSPKERTSGTREPRSRLAGNHSGRADARSRRDKSAERPRRLLQTSARSRPVVLLGFGLHCHDSARLLGAGEERAPVAELAPRHPLFGADDEC
jgi:hypothetical protein